MSAAEWIFWSSIAAVAYNYAGYPVVLFIISTFVQAARDLRFLLSRCNRRCRNAADSLSVAVLIAAYNEQEVIADKLRNTASLHYPREKFEVLLGLDAPTDATAEEARTVELAGLRIFEFPARRGKLAVLRDLAQCTSAEVLVFTDANTIMDPECLRNLVRHFADPRVGAVSGEEVRFGSEGCSGESLYWRYESLVKVLESRVGCLLGANGAVYAVRRELFDLKNNSLVEDLQIALTILFSGHRVVYDPEAVAMEDIVPSVEGQFQRRVRIAAGIFQMVADNPGYLNPLKGTPAFAFFSHRLLRLLAPFLLLAAIAANIVLVRQPLYAVTLTGQLVFYAMAAIGYWSRLAGKTIRPFVAPSQFCLMNAAYIFGFVRYAMRRQALTWQVTPRQSSATENAKSEMDQKPTGSRHAA